MKVTLISLQNFLEEILCKDFSPIGLKSIMQVRYIQVLALSHLAWSATEGFEVLNSDTEMPPQ